MSEHGLSTLCRLTALYVFLSLTLGFAAGEEAAKTEAPPPGPAGTEPGITSLRYSSDGRMALITIDPDNITAIKDVIQQFPFQSHGVTVTIYTPVGLLPQLMISGDPPLVKQFVDTARSLFLDTGEKHMVVICARLSELNESEIRDIGVNIFPSSITYDASFSKAIGESAYGVLDVLINNGTATNILQLEESLSKGKILVASEVFTPNGVKTQISDIQHVPVFSVDSFSNVQTQYQDLETSIEVTPTVIRFTLNDPAASTVRLDIGVKVSIISGERRMGTITAPEYTDKRFQTTRIFPADGKTYLVGTFVSDSEIKSESRVPVLSQIPLLKYLFRQQSTSIRRVYALLTLSVKVLPASSDSDAFRKPWFAKTKPPGTDEPAKQPATPARKSADPAKMLEHEPPPVSDSDLPRSP